MPMDRLSVQRLEELLTRARDIRVLVIGDIMLDVYLRGGATRISPEAPVPVVRVTGEDLALGGAANVATNVVALGAACSIVGCVGDDAAGGQLVRELTGYGIDASGVPVLAGRTTTVKTRVMVRHQQVARYDRESDDELSEAAAHTLTTAIRAAVAAADTVVLEDYNKGVLVPSVIRATIEEARAANKPTFLPVRGRDRLQAEPAGADRGNARRRASGICGMDAPHAR
jgi:D-beta-D-heptose 7-phosphate kinase/D-beta-D-heptose 1-phosphate adenosyltransferase